MLRLATTALATACLAGSALAQDVTLKMATIAPSLGQAITMATFANVVTDNIDGIDSGGLGRWCGDPAS